MQRSKSKLRKAMLLILSALGLMAVMAPGANAEVVPAKWGQETSGLRISGTLEVKDEWYEDTVTCTGQSDDSQSSAKPGSSTFKAFNANNNYYGVVIKVIAFDCGDTTLELPLSPYLGGSGYPGVATYDTETETYFLGNGGFYTAAPAFTSGFSGSYASAPLDIEFRNPGIEIVEVENEAEEMEEVEVEVKDSRLLFDGTLLGEAEGHGDIYASGTLIVDDEAGNPRTLSH
jgi:hypothetical protein